MQKLWQKRWGNLGGVPKKGKEHFQLLGYIRFKANLYVDSPLPTCFFQLCGPGEELWVQFKCADSEALVFSPLGNMIAMYGSWLNANNVIESCFASPHRMSDVESQANRLNELHLSDECEYNGVSNKCNRVDGNASEEPTAAKGADPADEPSPQTPMANVVELRRDNVFSMDGREIKYIMLWNLVFVNDIGTIGELNKKGEVYVSAKLPCLTPIIQQCLEVPHQSVYKSRTPHVFLERVVIPWPDEPLKFKVIRELLLLEVGNVYQVGPSLLGELVPLGTVIDQALGSKKRKAQTLLVMVSQSISRAPATTLLDQSLPMVSTFSPLRKRAFWDNLEANILDHGDCWMCVGDLNVIAESHEKVEGTAFRDADGNILRDFCLAMRGVDLGFLDVSNQDPTCREVVKVAWETDVQGFESFKLAVWIGNVRSSLKQWNKLHFGHCQNQTQASGISSAAEVKKVVWSMHPFKAPGPNGTS
ncbi:hypothetical protein L484_010717 [Morus notabilis]|uniref:Endonuclease/exonuclease/phosphatase domain-containing protein n=1 Tax=Morus notabilis TaxID=981085 RepID=W9RI16_9ROSA|nr:hypothetical protein L484_010717 [Morus notabilis]